MTKTIEIDELKANLDALVSRIQSDDFSKALEDCREPIASGMMEIFSKQQDSEGNTWPPHAPMTIALHGVHPLLILTGVMYGSVTQIGGESHVETIDDKRLTWGTDVPYGPKQNFGGANDNGTYTPAREFMYFTEDAKDGCEEAVWRYIEDVILGEFD